jgi:3',5'-cyclic AMP phosphodiesterase CpdA
MPRIAQLSDLHFGEASPAAITALAASVRAAAPDAIAVSGDLTAHGRTEEFDAAFAFLASLGAPVLAVPGNHDIPAWNLWQRLMNPRRGWRRASDGVAGTVLDVGGVRLLGLDTVSRAQWHLDWSAGAIPLYRREALARQLSESGQRDVVIVCHHPLRHPDWAGPRHLPRGATATLALLGGAKVRAVLCGHLHRAWTSPLGVGDGMLVIAPSGLSPRPTGTVNGWNLIDMGPGGMAVHTQLHLEGPT